MTSEPDGEELDDTEEDDDGSDAELVRSLEGVGCLWGDGGLLSHPADPSLNFRRHLCSGRVLLSPRLVERLREFAHADDGHAAYESAPTDRATPNLPSRDLAATSAFYGRLEFRESFRDDSWMILARGPIQIEFFPCPGVDPLKNVASCCVRAADAAGLHRAFSAAGLPTSHRSTPRITPSVDQPWGFREFAVVDPDGNLLRCLSPLPKGDGVGVTS